MGYRTLEISSSCEIHIKEGLLEVTSDSGSILIPIEDLSQIMVHGANIRIGPEVFMRVVQNRKASEKQYNNIYMVTGEPDYQEKTVGVNCHIMI